MAAEGMGGRGEAACSSPKKTNQLGMDGWMDGLFEQSRILVGVMYAQGWRVFPYEA